MTLELALVRGAFPAAPPENLDDPRVIVQHDWSAFAALRRMTNHWDRPGWSDGRRAYYWMLLPRSEALIERTLECQRELHDLGLDMIPDDGLHVTVLRVGERHELSAHQLDRLADAAGRLVPKRFTLDAHPLSGSRGAVRYTLSPWTPLIHLHAALSRAGREVEAPGGGSTAAFRPHLGIAYNGRDRPAAAVIEAVARLRSLPPVQLEIPCVSLVELRRERANYRWTVVREVPLPA